MFEYNSFVLKLESTNEFSLYLFYYKPTLQNLNYRPPSSSRDLEKDKLLGRIFEWKNNKIILNVLLFLRNRMSGQGRESGQSEGGVILSLFGKMNMNSRTIKDIARDRVQVKNCTPEIRAVRNI